MAKTKEQKQKILEDLKEKIARQKALVFIDWTGVKVKDLFALRKNLKASDSELKAIKKTLLEIVLKEKDLEKDFVKKNLKGQIGLVLGYKDQILPAKITYQISQINQNLKILGGILENKFFTSQQVIELAQLPTKEGLLGKVVGSIFAPVSNFVNVLETNIKGLIYVLAKAKT